MNYIGHIIFVVLVIGIVYHNSAMLFNMPDLCELTQEVCYQIEHEIDTLKNFLTH